MMKNNKKYLFYGFFSIVLLAVVIFLANFITTSQRVKESEVSETNTPNASYILLIDDGTEEKNFTIEVTENNLFTDMENLVTKGELKMEYSESSYGIFITSLNDFTPDPKTSFWKMYFNDAEAQVGVLDIFPASGDEILFQTDLIQNF